MVGCNLVSGLLLRCFEPLALMVSALITLLRRWSRQGGVVSSAAMVCPGRLVQAGAPGAGLPSSGFFTGAGFGAGPAREDSR